MRMRFKLLHSSALKIYRMQAAEEKAIYQMSLTPGMAFITGPEGRKAEQEAIAKDHDFSYRLIVNIVGRERQGKTSLRKLLSNDPFDENEQSTVGVDHELVDTIGLEPDQTQSWSKLNIRKANTNEYDEILGKHVMIRLRQIKYKKLKHKLAPFIICGKIEIMALLTYFIYILCSWNSILVGFPWFGILLHLLFGVSTLSLGITEGTAIAVGIRHMIILVDAWFRWDLASWCLSTDSEFSLALSVIAIFVIASVLECCISVTLGLSLGVGIACFYCMCIPPQRELYVSTNPLLTMDVHVMLFGCLLGLVLHNYITSRLLFVFSVLLFGIYRIHPKSCITFTTGIFLGVFHIAGLKIGQNMYCIVNKYMLLLSSSTRCRRFIRHAIGFLPGLFFTHLFGWKFSPDFSRVVVALSLALQLEFFGYLNSKRVKDIKNQTNVVNHPSKVISARIKSPRLKLVVRDFAGHPLYYDAHHVYMTGQCVYLLVFSLVDAQKNFKSVFQDILKWLLSIRLHNQYPETRVFLVGTHRDDPNLKKWRIPEIGRNLKSGLPRMYHNMIVWNQDDTPLFPVENSVRSEHDMDHKNLRDRILKQTTDLIFQEKIPVKLFFFFNVIEFYQRENVLCDTFQNVHTMCNKMGLCGYSEDEFIDMLDFFHRMGEIMYRQDDDILNTLIIFEPRNLLNILSHIITIPRISERPHMLISDWTVLEEHGICSSNLFDHLVAQYSQGASKEHVVAALCRFNLICKCNKNVDRDSAEDCFIIPFCLPKQLPYPERCWAVLDTDKVFYIKCQPYFPQSLFFRLLCVCVSYNNFNTYDEQSPNMCNQKAIFTFKDKLCYQLELCMGDKLDLHGLLKVVIRDNVKYNASSALKVIWQSLSSIVKQDFKMCTIMQGILCPHKPPHEDGSLELHILPMVISGNECADLYSSIHSEFWCCGRNVKIDSNQMLLIGSGGKTVDEGEKKSAVNFADKLIMNLPNHVYKVLCNYLNPSNPLGKDWTMLAGLVDLTAKEVELIKFQSPTNPCSAVLQSWCSKEPDVTMGTLIAILHEMERYDVIQTMEDLLFDSKR